MSKYLSAKYYRKIKEMLLKKLLKDVKIFLNKRNKKRQQYCCQCYKNLSENEKNKLVEHRKKYYKMRKNGLL